MTHFIDHTVLTIKRVLAPVEAKPVSGYRFTAEQVYNAVLVATGVEDSSVRGPNRERKATHARYLAMWALYTYAGISKAEISIQMRRDHWSSLRAIKQIELELRTSPETRAKVDQIVALLEGSMNQQEKA